MLVVPRTGISQNPARKVPAMLPRVEIAYRFPTVAPELMTALSFSLTAKGDTMPSNMLAGANRMTAPHRVRVIMLSKKPTMTSRIRSFASVVMPIRIAA